MKTNLQTLWLALIGGILFCWDSVRAEQIEFINGDRYSGKVLALTETVVKLNSDIQGIIEIPREKVVAIYLRPDLIQPRVPAPAKENAPQPSVLEKADAPDAQMFDPQMIEQVQKQMLGTASPEANQMFNDLISGLNEGSVNVSDIRKMAQDTVKQVEELKEDLGDDVGFALDGYLAILKGFIQKTAPEEPLPDSGEEKID